MATLSLRIMPASGSPTTASVNLSDANAARILAAYSTAFSTDGAGVLTRLLRRLVSDMVETTKAQERQAIVVNDIPIS